MELLTLFLRTVLIYFSVFLMLRIMGKREIGKLSTFDLVISIMIAEIAVFVIEDIDKSLLAGMIPMATLVGIQLLFAFISLKNNKLRKWIDGQPSLIIFKGKINREEMKRQRYNLDDLMAQLRQCNVSNVADVEFAVLETTGKLNVIKKEKDEPPLKDPANRFRYEGLPLPLILDGKVQDDNLQSIGQTRFWLKKVISEKGAADFKEVFFCTIDHKGNIFLDKQR